MYQIGGILTAALTYVLVLLRVGCLAIYAPFLSSEVFPSRIRIYLAMVLPILLLPTAARTSVAPPYLDMMELFLLAGQEFTVGLAIGFLGSLVFTGVQMAGEVAGQQIGFSMANVMDPQSGIEVPILGFLNMNLTLMIFITSNLHLVLIYIMAKSYDFIGIGAMLPEVNFNNPVLSMTQAQATALMKVGVQMALPIMSIMLMNSIVEGFVTKTMPQMNIQVFGMPLRVVLGLTVMVFIYPSICMALVPYDWQFNLTDMPEGPLGDTLVDLSVMVEMMGAGGR